MHEVSTIYPALITIFHSSFVWSYYTLQDSFRDYSIIFPREVCDRFGV